MYSSALLSSEKNGIAAFLLNVFVIVNASHYYQKRTCISFVDEYLDEKWE